MHWQWNWYVLLLCSFQGYYKTCGYDWSCDECNWRMRIRRIKKIDLEDDEEENDDTEDRQENVNIN